MSERKIIVTIAPTGGMAHKKQNANLPTQPDEIAKDVYDCYNAGASIVAVHARRPDDLATCNPAIYHEINEKIRSRCDIILNNSTGGGVHGDMVRQRPDGVLEISWEERLKGMEAGAEMCTLDPTTIVASFDGQEIEMNTSPSRCRELAEKMKERGIKPEWEVFSLNHLLQDTNALIDAGLDDAPPFVNLVLNAHRGFQGALPYTPAIMQMMVDALPKGAEFCASAIGPAQLPAAMNSLLLGGHVRTGLEDNLFFSRGQLATNVKLVERTVRLVEELGFSVANPTEAREILGLSQNSGVRPEFAVS